MLVLTRGRDQRIMIGDDIVITVVEVRRGHVRLGIDAPRAMPVHREEVYQARLEQGLTGNDPAEPASPVEKNVE